MLNFNGVLFADDECLLKARNRGLQYGDAVFEQLRVVNGDIYFLEDHYLRLMSSMRILRMEIPMYFTMEYMETEILKTVTAQKSSKSAEVKCTFFRNSGDTIVPFDQQASFIILANVLRHHYFTIDDAPYEIELYKDFYKSATMLSNLSTTNGMLNVLGAIYAAENDYHDCLLLNERKMVAEAIHGAIFLVKGTSIKTPPLSDGCTDLILRKKLIEILKKVMDFELLEESISPFELQKADELFVVNTIKGIVPVSTYRKKNYSDATARMLVGKLNAAARITLSAQR